ncbi:MAG TPA: ATP-binding protein [Phycisphaerae bacterium]|nr:ATP-binding protein [Phycisphaerae bacterium]
MSDKSEAVIGHIIDVQGSVLTASLVEDEQERIPTVTIGDEDILVGQLGTYVAIHQGEVNILALVSRMTEQEKVAPLAPGESGAEVVRLSFAQRVVRLVPVGTLRPDGGFERGVSTYPTTGAEVRAVGSRELEQMFSRYRSKGYEVGALSSHPALTVCLDPSSLFARHFAVLGQTGAGKSWTVASLAQRAVKVMPRAHIILLDVHGEYCWTAGKGNRHSAFDDSIFRYVDARELEIPYWLMTYAELCDLLIDQTDYSAHNQTAAFREALNALRTEEGQALRLERTTLDTPIFFDLMKLRGIIEAKNGTIPSPTSGKPIKGPLTGAFDNFLMRLDSRLNDVRYDFLLKPKIRSSSDSLSALLRDFVGLGKPKRPVTVIDLSSVPFDVRPTVAAQIGRLAFEFNYWNPQFRDFPILLVCEEAHAYIPRATVSQFAGSRRSMERIAKEGRKYGVGLGVVSQRPHEVSETVLSQCGTFLCLRLTNPDDQSYVRSLVPEAERDLVDILAGLGRGEAMVLGEAVPLPTRLHFHRPKPAPSSDDVDFYEKWRSGPEDLNVDAIVDRWRRQERGAQ